MERIESMERAIQKYRQERLNSMHNQMKKYVESLEPSFCKMLSLLISEQVNRQAEDENRKVQNLYLGRLHSSDYTDSRRAIFGISSGELYYDENRSQIYWYPVQIYETLEKDMETVVKLLRQTFIRLQESEIFAMKKRLLYDNWLLAEVCFLALIQKNYNLLTESTLRLEKEIQIQCGDYMNRLKIIDVREGETVNG